MSASRWGVLGLMGLFVGACATTSGASVAPKAAPDFTLPAMGGGEVSLAATRGSVTLVDFWASWCAPCQQELPELEKLKAIYESKGVKFVAVTIDEDREAAADAAKRLGLTMMVALDAEKKAASLYNPPTMPSSYVLDRAGRIRFVHAGFDGTPDVKKFREELDALLAEP